MDGSVERRWIGSCGTKCIKGTRGKKRKNRNENFLLTHSVELTVAAPAIRFSIFMMIFFPYISWRKKDTVHRNRRIIRMTRTKLKICTVFSVYLRCCAVYTVYTAGSRLPSCYPILNVLMDKWITKGEIERLENGFTLSVRTVRTSENQGPGSGIHSPFPLNYKQPNQSRGKAWHCERKMTISLGRREYVTTHSSEKFAFCREMLLMCFIFSFHIEMVWVVMGWGVGAREGESWWSSWNGWFFHFLFLGFLTQSPI